MASTPRYFVAKGKVQNVMFRQTLMRAALKRGLVAGATNSKTDKRRVDFTLIGDTAPIAEIIDFMSAGKALNSWGARAESVVENDTGMAVDEHTVSTFNVDNFKWKQNVEFYI
eukprot:TRINITY_DN68073_c7_g3_i1.p2 TRINITY_DN68073_c7_g3~~TRINITY_DN68073_c7_g3_i1.p2  ORF type:complete len:113 (-),score=17.21 TRINITY_DN68073_c7_g3_i1:647-985(-)